MLEKSIMEKPWSQYEKVVVETYSSDVSGRSKIRVRPISGQKFPQTMVVECSKSMRENHPIGTRFRISAKESRREGGKLFLYSGYTWPYEVIE
jgi:hypothetical protein